MLITVVSLLIPLGMDVKFVFLQVVFLKLHVHSPGHAVTVATCKMDRMAMTQEPRALTTMIPVKYDNKFEKLRYGTVRLLDGERGNSLVQVRIKVSKTEFILENNYF
jgi:hypothetical protein